VVCLIGDNCNVNKSIFDVQKIPLVGCASHRLNLAVQDFLKADESILAKVTKIMSKLSNLVLGAKLRKFTNLRPVKRNATRWSSSLEMLLRYERLKGFLSDLESEEIDDLILGTIEGRRVETLIKMLKDIESVTKLLQAQNTTMSNVRSLFDALEDAFPEMKSRLGKDAAIVHSVDFESVIVKIQLGKTDSFSASEVLISSRFKLPSAVNDATDGEELSFAERALKRQRMLNGPEEHKYMDTRFIIPTSNDCERLFSKVGFLLNDRRKSILPSNLESQIFLHANNDLWSGKDFTDVES